MKKCFLFSVYGGRASFFEKGLLVAVRSVRLTNPAVPIVVLYDNLSPADVRRLEGCTPVRVDSSIFRSEHRRDLTVGAYFKLCLDRLDGYDRVLYLDSDLVVLDDLQEVFAMDGVLIARRERYDLAHEYLDPARVASKEGLAGGPFMNSGVVCFDRNFWVKEKILGRALDIAAEYGWDFFRNSDQGILNILARRAGGFTPLPLRFNYCRWPEMVYGRFGKTEVNRLGFRAPAAAGTALQRWLALGLPAAWAGVRPAAVVHWNGPVKPWEFDEKGMSEKEKAKYFYECYRQFEN